MTPSAIRNLLLDQHARLRGRLATTEALAEKLRAGDPVRGAFRHAVTMLLEELTTHNVSEETLLEPVLRAGDVYADARVARMHTEHLDEHMIMQDALACSDLAVVAENLPDLAETLRAHMEAEERTFLHPGVLRDG